MHEPIAYNLYLALSVDAKRYVDTKAGKLAPGAFAAQVPELIGERVIVGEGFVSNSEALFAYAICAALDKVFLNDETEVSEDESEFALRVLASSVGSNLYLNSHVPKWLANGGRNSQGEVPNNFELWKRCYLMSAHGKLSVTSATGIERSKVTALSKIARRHKDALHNCSRNEPEGLIRTFLGSLESVSGR